MVNANMKIVVVKLLAIFAFAFLVDNIKEHISPLSLLKLAGFTTLLNLAVMEGFLLCL